MATLAEREAQALATLKKNHRWSNRNVECFFDVWGRYDREEIVEELERLVAEKPMTAREMRA